MTPIQDSAGGMVAGAATVVLIEMLSRWIEAKTSRDGRRPSRPARHATSRRLYVPPFIEDPRVDPYSPDSRLLAAAAGQWDAPNPVRPYVPQFDRRPVDPVFVHGVDHDQDHVDPAIVRPLPAPAPAGRWNDPDDTHVMSRVT